MSLLGQAALAMWWDIAPGERAEFEHWHTHEHFPERLAIPGFLRASRWRSAEGGEGFFVLYELEGHGVLSSAGYLARLNAPTPWSARMMPRHRNMVRSQCHVLHSRGVAVAGQVMTVRLSPAAGREDALRAGLAVLAGSLACQPGVAGVHLMRHETPAIAPTEEQKIRGLRDGSADWVLLAVGYEAQALQRLAEDALGEEALSALGAAPGCTRHRYVLSCAATPRDTEGLALAAAL